MAKEKYLECGKAVSTHGVRGTLRLECYCDTPEKLAKMRRMYIKTETGEMKLMKVRAASVQREVCYDKAYQDSYPILQSRSRKGLLSLER